MNRSFWWKKWIPCTNLPIAEAIIAANLLVMGIQKIHLCATLEKE